MHSRHVSKGEKGSNETSLGRAQAGSSLGVVSWAHYSLSCVRDVRDPWERWSVVWCGVVWLGGGCVVSLQGTYRHSKQARTTREMAPASRGQAAKQL
jgi:hypothetical protein